MLDHAILTSMIDAVSSQECYTVKTNFNKLLNKYPKSCKFGYEKSFIKNY